MHGTTTLVLSWSWSTWCIWQPHKPSANSCHNVLFVDAQKHITTYVQVNPVHHIWLPPTECIKLQKMKCCLSYVNVPECHTLPHALDQDCCPCTLRQQYQQQLLLSCEVMLLHQACWQKSVKSCLVETHNKLSLSACVPCANGGTMWHVSKMKVCARCAVISIITSVL